MNRIVPALDTVLEGGGRPLSLFAVECFDGVDL